MQIVRRLWEASWADDALVEDREKGVYADFDKIRLIRHKGEHFQIDAPHILGPSPQRTPFLFQAGSSPYVLNSLGNPLGNSLGNIPASGPI